MKRVFIIHGWSGSPEEGWLPWLKRGLTVRGYSVQVPLMPNPDEPIIEAWIERLASVVGVLDEQTFFVGHSIGCQAILRFVERSGVKVGGAVFVAGWTTLTDAETEEEKRIGKPWLETPINFKRIRSLLLRSVAVFSDDDPVVPLEGNRTVFEKELGSKIVLETEKGHFSGEDDVIELPAVLRALLEISEV